MMPINGDEVIQEGLQPDLLGPDLQITPLCLEQQPLPLDLIDKLVGCLKQQLVQISAILKPIVPKEFGKTADGANQVENIVKKESLERLTALFCGDVFHAKKNKTLPRMLKGVGTNPEIEDLIACGCMAV